MSDCQNVWLLLKSLGIAALIVSWTTLVFMAGLRWERETKRIEDKWGTYREGRRRD